MSSAATSSPVSASTLAYFMRWPVFRLSWLKETFSDSEVAGYSATGQVTSERRRKPFQLARGATLNCEADAEFKTNEGPWFLHPNDGQNSLSRTLPRADVYIGAGCHGRRLTLSLH